MQAAVSGQESGPVVYLLVGLTGAGKTTYAKQWLVPAGAVRLSVDERVHERRGRYGVDYPEREYFSLEAPVVAEVREELVGLFTAGRDVVLDHGLWLRSDRAEWKKLVARRAAARGCCTFPSTARNSSQGLIESRIPWPVRARGPIRQARRSLVKSSWL
ncbi:AAA family ATPase [Streptomyces sp. NPDC047453]|uniref:AAA family ATPase n=1 Tax=Streptomyces sp. NPDC047453 TaxID=3154812 RepID=UPI0033C495F0